MNDTFRRAYRPLTQDEQAFVGAIKDQATSLLAILNGTAHLKHGDPDDARAIALAKTKLEECVMWAVKAVTG